MGLLYFDMSGLLYSMSDAVAQTSLRADHDH